MEDQEGENMDGSSIKPVSSLRSHFEQMAKLTPKPTAAPPRPISPKPKIHGSNTIAATHSYVSKAGQTTLRPTSNGSISPTPPLRATGQRPVSTVPVQLPLPSPSVTIEPPRSPPKPLNLSLTLASPSALLTADGSRTASTSGSSSPHHFRIPSRPHTPLLESQNSSISPAVLPPEPPPPRRSGELRRDTSLKTLMGPPPPINRAEKPKIPSKQAFVGYNTEATVLNPTATSQPFNDRASPFSTPPSSNSSPRLDPLPPPPRTPLMSFEPPLVPHSLSSIRKDQESNGQGRAIISTQAAGNFLEQRPALPVRPPLNSSSSSAITSMDVHRPSKNLTIPVDTLGSSKSGVAIPRAIGNDSAFPTPPKRNFSTPTSQLQTPLRTHGRSMTVDQTSDRVPAEIRTPGKGTPVSSEGRDSVITTQITAPVGELVPFDVLEFPDSSLSNRRLPHFKQPPLEILTKYDTRIFDVCGKYVCTSGSYTRVWSLHDGEQVMSLSHGETIKILSLAFKPMADPCDEGSRLWLGNNFGELLEVKITSQNPVIATNNTAHNRREIIKIYRHANEMWTLDDSGTLHLWASDSTGSLNLETPSSSYRIPKGHSFSMVVNDELWHATGNDIRVFIPTIDGRTQFQVLQRPLSQSRVGEVSSGAVINGQLQKAYFGHTDGKVTIYSVHNYSCLGTVNVSIYKINSLAAVGDYLWAAYNTGMMYIYDTTQVPWVVKKDWRAHDNPVISVIADRSSFWKMDRLQVVSLGADNAVRPWDGLLQEDWLETELQAQGERFCNFEQIKTLVMTWNAGASTPHSLRYAEQDKTFFPDLLKQSGLPDILVFGFQELVDLEDKKTAAKSLFSKSKKKDPSEQEHMSHQYRDWRDYLIRCLDDSMPRDELYHLLYSSSLVGLFTCVFVRARLRDRIKGVCGAEVKRGMGGRAGNKGALILRFLVDDTSLCFINCHLAAGQNQVKDRNFDVSSILDSAILPIELDASVRLDSYIGGGDGTMILDHEICILNGDLNYRIDTMSRDAVINALKLGNIEKLLERDQLLASKRKRPAFRLRAFHEMPIDFAPTYKYDVGSDTYDTSEKKRAPAWCDRILYRVLDRRRLQQLDYRRHEVRVSDHRPVTGLFHMTVKTILPKKRAMVWEECRRRFEEVRRGVGASSNLDFLMNVCGLDSESCERLLMQQREGSSLNS